MHWLSLDDSSLLKPFVEPDPVKLTIAMTFRKDLVGERILAEFEREHGEVDMESACFDFEHTKYYEREMGPNLLKQFLSFKALYAREKLVEWKHLALKLEKKYAKDGKRRVNIDPTYLELPKLVVASTKNFAHRIYVGGGIFGDVQLRYQNNRFATHEWTYPDYATPLALGFFQRVRERYFQQLKDSNEPG